MANIQTAFILVELLYIISNLNIEYSTGQNIDIEMPVPGHEGIYFLRGSNLPNKNELDQDMQACERKEAKLARLDTVSKQQAAVNFIANYHDGQCKYIFGLERVNGIFKWIDDNTPLTEPTFWAPGYPSSDIREECAFISRCEDDDVDYEKRWKTTKCKSIRRTQLCQKFKAADNSITSGVVGAQRQNSKMYTASSTTPYDVRKDLDPQIKIPGENGLTFYRADELVFKEPAQKDEQTCRQRDGSLAIVDNIEKQKAAVTMVTYHHGHQCLLRIGLNRVGNQFRWQNGQALGSRTFWAPDEPSSNSSNNCVYMRRCNEPEIGYEKRWRTAPCSTVSRISICQWFKPHESKCGRLAAAATGSNSNVYLVAGLFIIVGVAIGAVMLRKKKKWSNYDAIARNE